MSHQKQGIQVIGNHCNQELKLAICRFVKYLKTQYEFPVLLKIILCDSSELISPFDQDTCVSFSWVPDEPTDIYRYPYILCTTGDYLKDKEKRGRDNALAAYIHDIAKHILRYQKWLKTGSINVYAINIKATEILDQYAETREHP